MSRKASRKRNSRRSSTTARTSRPSGRRRRRPAGAARPPRRTAGAERDRRRSIVSLGAHPERRVLSAARRDTLRRSRTTDPAAAVAAAIVLPPVVNMFEAADARSAVVSQAILGMTVQVDETRDGWALVETPDRYQGWMRAVALRPSAAPFRGTRRDSAFEVINLFANVYREPDVTSAAPIVSAPLLARFDLVEDAWEWKKIALPDGRAGWVHGGDVAPAGARPPSLDRPDAIAATAMRFLGLPYLWGGTTPFGLDCSGLTQLVYRLHGFLLPRDADLQIADQRLRPVGPDARRTGDLVFFGPEQKSITHVGLALGGADFVSATTYRAPVVRVDSLEDPYWAGLYRGARRAGVGLPAATPGDAG
jgi:cell wall-associated NlpC family hydrolase